jgi:hypothetical protein
MDQATPTLSPHQHRLLDQEHRVHMQLMTLARWLAHKAVKEEWRAQGTKVQYIPISETRAAAKLYLWEHKAELLEQAATRYLEQQQFICGTPFETRAMQERWKRLVKEAIRNKGGKVNSIAPGELQKLVTEYLAQNPNRRWNVHNS